MASGHVNRTQRPNTWLHRPSLRREDSPCQLGAVHTRPIGRRRSSFKFSSAPAICSIAGRSRSSKRKPASVTDTLRVVRCSRRTPRRSSSCRIEWLSADGVTLSCDAAARKLRCSATMTNAVRLASSARSIHELLSALNAIDIGFLFATFVNTLVRREFRR
jgi:hypothetical protein